MSKKAARRVMGPSPQPAADEEVGVDVAQGVQDDGRSHSAAPGAHHPEEEPGEEDRQPGRVVDGHEVHEGEEERLQHQTRRMDPELKEELR